MSANTQAKEMFHAQFYGPEPDLDVPYGKALNWYAGMKDTKDAREYLTEYLQNKEDIKKLKNVPDEWIPNSVAWIAKLFLRGFPVPDTSIEFLERKVQEAFSHQVIPTETEVVKHKPNVQEHIRDKTSELIGEIEGLLDDGTITQEWSLYDYLRARQISAMIANKLVDHFQPIVTEILEAFDPQDKQLKEAYKLYTTPILENMAVVYSNLLNDSIRYAANAKKARPIRAKKKPSIEKILKNFQYQKSDEELKIVSLDPSKILGSQELWTYNTKNKLLSVFRAADSDGLNIRRSLIININEQTSIAKKIGRKTEDRLHSVLTGGKVVLRNMMDDITGGSKLVTRIGKTTVLLRVL